MVSGCSRTEFEMAEPNLEQFEQNAERSRADLAGTVDELRSRVSGTADDLRHRVSAESLKGDVKEYVDRTRHEMLQNIKRKASENPLGAVAVGTGVAFLGWRILRSIPAPLVLLGVGVALLKAGERDNPITGAAVSGMGHRQDHDSPGESASSTPSGVESVGARIGEAATGAGAQASRMASAAASAVSDAASSVYRGGVDATVLAGDQAQQAGRKAQEVFLDTLERYPLMVGGVGLAIGGFIAALLPITHAEQRLLGETSDDLKERATNAATEGYEAAEAAGRRVLKHVLGEAPEGDPSSEGRLR
jgi:hypothetical protein